MAFRLSAFYFAFFAYAGVYVAYFPLYLAHRGLSAAQIASVLALPALARIFVPAAWGWVADRTGAHREIVAFSCAVTAAGFAVMPFTPQIAIVIGLMSLLAGGALPLVEAITMGSLAGQAGRYGPIRLWGSISFLLVVLAGGAWLDHQPVSALPAAAVAFMLAALAVALTLRPSARRAIADAPAWRISPAIAHLMVAGFCNAAAHGALYAFLTLHLDALGYSGTMIGVLWTVGVVAEVAVFLWLPRLFRRFSLSAILAASLAAGAVRFLAIGWLADVLWIVLLAQTLHAATFGAFHAASVAAVHRLFPEHAQARGQTLFSSLGNGGGAAAGVLLAGWAWDGGGAGLAFSACAAACAAGAFFAARLKRANL